MSARDERVAICVEAGVSPARAEAVAECEERMRTGASSWCACGAGHRPLKEKRRTL